jgi:hypothetical protein
MQRDGLCPSRIATSYFFFALVLCCEINSQMRAYIDTYEENRWLAQMHAQYITHVRPSVFATLQ